MFTNSFELWILSMGTTVMLLSGCGDTGEDTADRNTMVKDLSASDAESLCDGIASAMADAELSTKEQHCISEVWGLVTSPEACEEAVVECVAKPDEELDNIDAQRQSLHDSWFEECINEFVSSSATYTVAALDDCADAMAEASACIWNNGEMICDNAAPGQADAMSAECTQLDDEADSLCAILE